MFIFRKWFVAFVTLLLIAMPRITTASGVFIVNSGTDAPDAVIDGRCETQTGNGVCTLRAALDEVNASNGNWRQIVIGAMTITLSPQYGELHLQSGAKVSIVGAGAGTIIDAGIYSMIRILDVDNGAWLQVRNLSLTNGSASCCGGGIENRGTVYLDRVTLSGNRATASGTVGNAGRGAAIFNESGAVLVLQNSTLTNNQSRGSGGAIRNEGTLTVLNSTFVNNDAYAGGGGAIANTGTTLIYTSTFSGNHSAGAGAIWNDVGGRVHVYSTTFANNYTHSNVPSVTVENASTMVLYNTLLDAAPGGTNCVGSVTSAGFNLSNDLSCQFTRFGDQQGVDPKLGPLAYNGGLTQTHRLLLGSAAIDAGLCVGFDQRGYLRPVRILPGFGKGNRCDVGSFELQRIERP